MLTIDDIIAMTDDQLRARKGELADAIFDAERRLKDLGRRFDYGNVTRKILFEYDDDYGQPTAAYVTAEDVPHGSSVEDISGCRWLSQYGYFVPLERGKAYYAMDGELANKLCARHPSNIWS